jgi:hypothetical protein
MQVGLASNNDFLFPILICVKNQPSTNEWIMFPGTNNALQAQTAFPGSEGRNQHALNKNYRTTHTCAPSHVVLLFMRLIANDSHPWFYWKWRELLAKCERPVKKQMLCNCIKMSSVLGFLQCFIVPQVQ